GPEGGSGPVALRVLQRDVVELGDRLVLLAGGRVAARRPVERVVGEGRVAVVGREAIELRDGAGAILAREPVEHGEVVGALGDVHRARSRLLARDLAAPLVVLGRSGRRLRRGGGRRGG